MSSDAITIPRDYLTKPEDQVAFLRSRLENCGLLGGKDLDDNAFATASRQVPDPPKDELAMTTLVPYWPSPKETYRNLMTLLSNGTTSIKPVGALASRRLGSISEAQYYPNAPIPNGLRWETFRLPYGTIGSPSILRHGEPAGAGLFAVALLHRHFFRWLRLSICVGGLEIKQNADDEWMLPCMEWDTSGQQLKLGLVHPEKTNQGTTIIVPQLVP